MTGPGTVRDLAEVLRDELVERDRIVEVLRHGPCTLPEIAAALGAPAPEVVRWVMAMRRYGLVRELPKPRADDYYRYVLAEEGR
ncbi:MAG TPA: MarR family transcriptional regulator [Thermoplasmata archaeon]|nr:MarR family transcriptional regulator [Thermoplasmata archaeon]